ncbi:MAG TPA: DnaA/Hda family protein [Gemmatimonadaceae bacterium]|nr:DnaA/Hda family protein [Gemmatimonadaceae bacterium]
MTAGFDTLVVGAANRLAVAAASAVAESPGQVYNPLFIYGDSGLGKTHILHAIAGHVRARSRDALVEYVTLVDLIDAYHAAVAAGTMDQWAAGQQQLHVLLVDDIQFLTGRRETQTDLLRLFSAMQDEGRQIVLTSDRPPADISDVDERLIARLAGGLVVDIGAPDFETRAAILRALVARQQVDVGDELLAAIAHIEFSNVRELHGALNRLLAHRAVGQDDLRAEDIARAFGMEAPGPRRRRSIEAFQSYLAGMPSPSVVAESENVARLNEAIALWSAEGFRTDALERARSAGEHEDVGLIIDAFTRGVEHLRVLERRAVAADPALAGHDVFRDPGHVDAAEAFVARALAGELPPPGPSSAYARASFEVSTSNALAARAADAIIAEPGARYNPFVIHGPAGVGKTHLAHAIGNALAARGMRVACVTAPRFTDELISAIGAGTVNRWRARYRAVDALVVEDVDQLASRERSQEELFHIINALLAAGKQMVFTSSEPPRRVPELEERLRTRFDAGLVAPIGVPDRALREKVAIRVLTQDGQQADADAVHAIAEKAVPSLRELIAQVHRLALSFDGGALTAAMVRGDASAARRLTPIRPLMRAVDATFLDREKVVWEWPDPTVRIIEELR